MSTWKSEQATLDDFPALTMLETEIQAQHVEGEPGLFLPDGLFSRETYAAYFADPNQGVLLGVEDGEAVGYLHYEIVDKPQSEYLLAQHYVHVHALSIKAEHRRKGYGDQLMEYVVQLAKDQGISDVRLEVWAFNEGAQKFYRRLGFRTLLLKMMLDLE